MGRRLDGIYQTVWFKGHVPKYAFILWMAYKKKMLTRQKLKRWGYVQDDTCVLCNGEVEDMNHLFFNCGFSKAVWTEALRRNGITRIVGGWDEECDLAIREGKGDNFIARIRKLVLFAAVYLIWQERNCRVFQHMGHDWLYVIRRIEEVIREATWFWREKRTYGNWVICREWGLNDCKVLS